MATTLQEPQQLRQILQHSHTIAVVGLSPKPNRPSHQVAAAMQGFGYKIIPVRPATESVLGEPCYASLYDVPEPDSIDIVDVFRAPEHVDEIVTACIALKLPLIWLQDGVINETAAQRAVDAGIQVVMNRCIYRDYINLMQG